jgi:SAM-dependent methyltransferase
MINLSLMNLIAFVTGRRSKWLVLAPVILPALTLDLEARTRARGLPRPLAAFFRQFGRPEGSLGAWAGRAMAWKNRAGNRLGVDLLALSPSARVLDIGCGPGVAVAVAAERVPSGTVTGVDPSEVMVRQANARNRFAARAGRERIVRAGAERLPLADSSITHVLAVNSLQHWDDLEAGLAEVRRVLVPGGRFVALLRLRDTTAGAARRAAHGYPHERLDDLRARAREAGFDVQPIKEHTAGGERIAALITSRPAVARVAV